MEFQSDKKSTLARLLREEIDSAKALLQFLQKEVASLASDQAFVDLQSDTKLKLINMLQQATGARMQFAAQNELPLGPLASADGLTGPDSEPLQSLYSHLTGLAQQCFEENRRIGKLINRRTRFVTRILDSVTPGGGDSRAVSYEESGRPSSARRNNLLDLAGI
ncbi:MAG: flagellar protein FlgN [Gammaproteobacteria bacterium]|nr:flagellar protein FlgN [Pseudomonadales bacterium]MCP5349032.1 flagellar protein FlgN [Pseudomonadales bacterium]